MLSGPTRCFRSSLFFPYIALKSNSSPRVLGSFYWRMVFRDQDLGTGCACCFWVIIAFMLSQQTELGYMCVCTKNVCKYIYLCVCTMCIHVYKYMCAHMCMYIYYVYTLIYVYRHICNYFCVYPCVCILS